MPSGKIADDKVRMSILVPKDRKEEFEHLASHESRSISSLVNYLMSQYIENYKNMENFTGVESTIDNVISKSVRSGNQQEVLKAKLTIGILKSIYPDVNFHFAQDIQFLLDNPEDEA
jgi:hypothetical protein